MKKKLTIAAAIIAIVAIIATGATLAYFTDEDDATNTFTVGKIDIELEEPLWDALEDEDKVIIPNKEIDKDPTVTVKADSVDCYVRLVVTVDNYAVIAKIDSLSTKLTAANLDDVFVGYDSGKWEFASKTLNDDGTATFVFNYFEMVEQASTDTELEPLFTSIKIPADITGDQLVSLTDANGEFNIDIKAEAIQAEGFADAAAAFTALDAI